MALNANTVKFLLKQLRKGTMEGFISSSAQIFNYLKEEVKDNPIYTKYEFDSEKWADWLKKEARIDLILPSTFPESKILAYAAYKEIGSMENIAGTNFVLSLFAEGHI